MNKLILILLLSFLTVNLITAEQFGYNYLDQGDSVIEGFNYSINVNTSNYALDSDKLDGQHGSYYAVNSSLGNYVPYQNATSDVDLGSYAIKSSSFKSDGNVLIQTTDQGGQILWWGHLSGRNYLTPNTANNGWESDLGSNQSDYTWRDLWLSRTANLNNKIILNGTSGNINTTGNVTANYFKGNGSLLTGIIGTNYTSDELWINKINNNFTFNESKLSTIYYNATSYAIISSAGTLDGGTLANTQHKDADYDSVTMNFSCRAIAPALDLRFNITNGLTSFNQIIVRYKTSAISGTSPVIQLWNYNENAWEDYGFLSESLTFVSMVRTVFDNTEHIQNGIVQLRFYKSATGNTNNKFYFDWIAISKGFGTPTGSERDPQFNTWLNDPMFEHEINATNVNITTTGTGLFGFIGSILSRVNTGWFNNINVNGTSNLSNTIINSSGINTPYNVTANYFIGNGSLLTGISGDNSSWNESKANSLYAKYNFTNNNFNGSGNFTTTGTVQAEHLYSIDDLVIDDDATISGNLGVGASYSTNDRALITLSSSDTSGLRINATSPFTQKRVASYGGYVEKVTNVTYDEYTQDTSTYGLLSKLTVNGKLTGTIGSFANYLRNNAGSNELIVTGAHDATSITFGVEEINVGLQNKVTRSGTLTNTNNLVIRNYASYDELTDSIVYNKAGNSTSIYDSIVKAKYVPSGSASAGTMNRYAYLFDVDIANSNAGSFVDLTGIRITSSGNPFFVFTGTTYKGIDLNASQGITAINGYGIYLNGLPGTTKWGFYNNVASAHNLLGLDNTKNYLGTGLGTSIWANSTGYYLNSSSINLHGNIYINGTIGLTGNYTNGNCWQYFVQGILKSTNCSTA